MKWQNSSSQSQFGVGPLLVRDRQNKLLQTYSLSVWMGTSDLSVDRRILEAFSHSSSSPTALHEPITTAYYYSDELDAEIDKILSFAADEGFEDGMEGRMFESLNIFLSEHPTTAMPHLATRLGSEQMNQGVSADIVRALGQIDHVPSHDDRVYLAECLLYSTLPLARDAGALALGDLQDEHSIPALQRAVEKEQIPALKADMQVSLDELIKDTDGVRPEET